MFEVWGVQVNLLALILAMIANIVVGMLWYSPLLFGKKWQNLVGTKGKEMSMSTNQIVLSLLVAALMAVGLNSVLQFTAKVSLLDPVLNVISTAFMVTGTFVVPTLLNEVIYEKRNFQLFLINVGNQFATLLAMGTVLAFFVL